MTTIALFNDTGNHPHVGCLAVSEAHRTLFRRHAIEVRHQYFWDDLHDLWQGTAKATRDKVRHSSLVGEIRDVDAVVVNGEGTIHHGYGSNLLAILDVAQEMGIPTFLVNALVQECPFFLDTLSRLTDCTVRDQCTSDYLSGLHIPHRMVPDSILECPFAKEADRDYAGRIVVTDWHPQRNHDIGLALTQFREALGDEAVFYPLEHRDRFADWKHAVANLAQARLVVTGRHHGVYLAAMARVPFVALPSNSFKVEGLLAMFNNRIQMCDVDSQLYSVSEEAIANRSLYEDFSEFLYRYTPLSTFEGLKPGRIQDRAAGSVGRD